MTSGCFLPGLQPIKNVRFQYLEVKGPCRTSSITKSKVVLEAAAFFYIGVYERLHKVYGDKTSRKVTIVCPFAETLEWWDGVIKQRLYDRLAAKGLPPLSRDHHPRIISNSEDKDIRATSTLPTRMARSSAKAPSSKTWSKLLSLSRAKEAVLIIGNSCGQYNDRRFESDPNVPKVLEMESALNAAHRYASLIGGLCKLRYYTLKKPLVALRDIPEALLLDEEREAYAKLSESADEDLGIEKASEGQDEAESAKDGLEETEK